MTSKAIPAVVGTRNTERTRRAVLDAATQAIVDRGTGVSLTYVASLAGVSKSGLLHHFGTRAELFTAVVDDANERFRVGVLAHLDLSENYPGKMLRAYVRALCGGSADVAQYFASAPTWNGLYAIPSLAAAMEADARWWTEQFTLDGVDAHLAQVVRRAAEGIAAAAGFGEETADDVVRGRETLLAMTEPRPTTSPVVPRAYIEDHPTSV